MSFDKVKEIMVDTLNLDEDEIGMESSLKEDLGIDSLDAMELVMALEEAYGMNIAEEELQGFVTVKNIVDFIDRATA